MSDSTIASISADGVLRAIAPGVVLAFAEAEGIRGSVEILISPARVAEVGLRVEAPALITKDVPRVVFSPVRQDESAASLIATADRSEGVRIATDRQLAEARSLGPSKRGDESTFDSEYTRVASRVQRRVPGVRRRYRRRNAVGAVVLVAALALAVETQGRSGTAARDSQAKDSSRSSPVAGGSVMSDSIVRDTAVVAAAKPDSNKAEHGVVADPVVAAEDARNAGVSVDIVSLPVELVPGGHEQIVAEVRDSLDNILSIPVRWRSSDKKVVTVDSRGVVRALSAGSAVVYASVGKAGSNVSVRVKP